MFIYGLIDPNDGALRYVGQTKSPKERLWGHIGMAPRMRRSKCAKWIRGLRKLGLKPQLEVLEETDKADDTERFWIASLRVAGASLLNVADGGEGNPGVARPDVTARFKGVAKSDKTRQRMSKSKTAAVRAAVGGFHRGRTRSQETRDKMSAAQKAKPFTEEKAAQLAKARLASPVGKAK